MGQRSPAAVHALIGIAVVCGMASPIAVLGGEGGNPYNQCEMFGVAEGEVLIWRGEASFVQSKRGQFEGGSSSERSTVGVSYDETFEARAVATVCSVSCGPLGTVKGRIKSSDFFYERTDQFSSRSTSDDCISTRNIDGTLVGEIGPSSEEGVGGMLTVSPDGSYQLLLTVIPFFYHIRGSSTEVSKDGCSGKTKQLVSITRPDVVPGVSGTFDNSVAHVLAPIVAMRFQVMYDGRMSDGKIEGDDDLEEPEVPARSRAVIRVDGDDGPRYTDRTRMEWSLAGVSLCDEVEQALRADLAFLMAYNDTGPMIQAREGKLSTAEYEKLVDRLAVKIFGDSWDASDPPPPSDEPSVDMGVDRKTCEMVGAEKMRQAREDSCEHDVIVESILAHERKHQEQCRNQHAQFASDRAEAMSRFEVEAYCVSVGHLLAWLKMHCSGDYGAYDAPYFGICG